MPAAADFKEVIEEVREDILNLKIADAIEELEDAKDKKLSDQELGQKYFTLGKLYQDQGQWGKSREALFKAIELHKANRAYSYYLMGHAFKEEGKVENAIKQFKKSIAAKPPRNIVYDARFELSEMMMQKGKARKAHAHLKYLERRWRGSFKHPEIVWRLIGVELKRKRKWQACRWARKMYSRYAGHPLAQSWGVDLPNNMYDGQALGCLSSPKEVKKRIKRLQLYGMSKRARQELELLQKRSNKENKYEVDIMLVEYLHWQGYPDEALKVLIPHYEDHQNDFDYLRLMGKVASKAGKYATAVGAYYKAYKEKPKSKKGRKALFSAAFLSYQFQDYDGASRKFKELRKRYRRSGLARDAKWHLAWIRYLKRDFVGAESDFKALLKDSYRRRRRRYRPFNNDRTRYWLAMSHLRQGEANEARELFEKIADNGSYTYYSILARTRLKETPGLSPDRVIASEGVMPLGVEDYMILPNPAAPNAPVAADAKDVQGENESEDTMASDDKEEEIENDDTKVESPEEAAEEALAEKVEVTPFKDPKLQARFDRANELIELGFTDWAKWEFYEIERRTRNKTYLRKLMDAYDKIGSYNRAVYISGIYFSRDRARGGFEAARDLWQWNFPKAYYDLVSKASSKFGVDEAFIYAIMRAESNFRKEAISPVGARGLMQIMPYTAEQIAKLLDDDEYTDEKLSKPELNVKYGARYLNRLQKKFEGLIPLSAAGYNAGPHRVYSWLNNFGNLDMDEFIEHIPFVETRNYVKKVTRHYYVYSRLYNLESNQPLAWLAAPVPLKVSARPSPRENWESLD